MPRIAGFQSNPTRCRITPYGGHGGVAAHCGREVFNAEDDDQARERVSRVPWGAEGLPAAGRRRGRPDCLLRLPGEHWSKLRSTHPLERVNKEIGGCTDVAGIFPNDASAMRLVGPLLIEQNDEWIVTRRQLSVESVTLILDAARSGENTLEQQLKKGGRRPQRRPRDDRPNDRAGALHTSDGLTISIR